MKNFQKDKLHKSIVVCGENKGFTLTEIIVTLVVMIIVAGVSAAAIINWQQHTKFRRQNENAKSIFTAASNQLTSLNAGNSLETFTDNFKNASGAYVKNCTPIDVTWLTNEAGVYYSDAKDVWTNDAAYSIISIRTHKGDYSKLVSGTLNSEEAKLVFKLLSDYITDSSILNSAIAIEFSPEAGQVFAVCCSDDNDFLYYEYETETGNPLIDERDEPYRKDIMVGYFGTDKLSVDQRDPAPIISAKINAEAVNGDIFGLDIYSADPDIKNTLEKYNYEITLRQKNLSYRVLFTASDSNKIKEKWNEVSLTFTKYKDNGSLENKNVTVKVPAKYVQIGDVKHVYFAFDAVDLKAQTYYFNITDSGDDDYKVFDNTYSFARFVRIFEGMSIENITFEIESISGKNNNNNENVQIDKGDVAYPASSDSNTVPSCPLFASRLVAEDITYTIDNIRHLYNIRYIEECISGGFLNGELAKERKYLVSSDMDWKAFIERRSLFAGSAGWLSISRENGAVNISPETKMDFPSFAKLRVDAILKSSRDDENRIISNIDIDYESNGLYKIIDIVDEYSAGLFIINEGQISGLELEKINVNGSKTTGCLAAANKGKINKIEISGNSSVKGGNATGGLVGDNLAGANVDEIKIDSDLTISGGNFTGGLFGINRSNVFGLYEINPKSVKGNYFVGGLIGGNLTKLEEDKVLKIRDGKIPQYIKGYSFVGGVIGYNSLSIDDLDINLAIRQLNEAVNGHVYSDASFSAANDFNTDSFVKTSLTASNDKKLTIEAKEYYFDDDRGDYVGTNDMPVMISEYDEDDEKGLNALSHAAGLIAFNSKYSEVVSDCLVETDLKGIETEYTYEQRIPGTGTKKYYIKLVNGGIQGAFEYLVGLAEFELNYSSSGRKYTFSKSGVLGLVEFSGELECLEGGLGTEATPNGSIRYYTTADLDYLYEAGKSITVKVKKRVGIRTYEQKVTYNVIRSYTGQPEEWHTTTATVNKGEYYGGIVAENYGTVTQNKLVKADIKGEREIGGLVAENHEGAVLNVGADLEVELESERNNKYNEAAYKNKLNAGGLVATNQGEILNTKKTEGSEETEFITVKVRKIKAYSDAGGLIAVQNSKKVLNLSRFYLDIRPAKEEEVELGEETARVISESLSAASLIGTATTDINISECINKLNIEANKNAAGMVGRIYGNNSSYLKNLLNLGNVEAKDEEGHAAGILADTFHDGEHTINDLYITSCVNAGKMAGYGTAGIAVNTDGKGTFNSCRNYGLKIDPEDEAKTVSLDAGITLGLSKQLAYCLDGADNSRHISADENKEYLNFYFGDEDLLYDNRYKVQSQYIYGFYEGDFAADPHCYFSQSMYKGTDDNGKDKENTSKPCHMTDLSGGINDIASYVLDKNTEAVESPDDSSYPDGMGIFDLNGPNVTRGITTYKTYGVYANEILDSKGKFNPTAVNSVSLAWNNATIDYPTVISENLQEMVNRVNAYILIHTENQQNAGEIWSRYYAASYSYADGNWTFINKNPSQGSLDYWIGYFYNNPDQYENDEDVKILNQAINICFGASQSDAVDYFTAFFLDEYIKYITENGEGISYEDYMAYIWPKYIDHLYDLLHPYVTYDYQIQVKAVDANGNEKNCYYLRSCTVVDEAYKFDTLNLSDTANSDGDAIDISKVVAINIEIRNVATNVKAFKDKVSLRAIYWQPADEESLVPMNSSINMEFIEVAFDDALEAAKPEHETALTSYKSDDDDYLVRFKGAGTDITGLSDDPSPVSNEGWNIKTGYKMMEEEDKKYLDFLKKIKDSGSSLTVQPDLTPLPKLDED